MNRDNIYIFSNCKLTIKNMVDNSNGKLVLSTNYDLLTLKYKNSEIVLLDKKGEVIENEESIPNAFLLITDDYEILKFLYKKYKLLFCDAGYESLVSYLNPKKHYKYYINIINEYIFECMFHMGVIDDVKDIEEHVYKGKKFFDEYIIEKGQILRYKIVKWKFFKEKIKTFFRKILFLKK